MALIVNASFGFLAYMSLGAGSGKVFGWYVKSSTDAEMNSRLCLRHIQACQYVRQLIERLCRSLTCRFRTAIAGLSSWFAIGVTYLRFRKGLKAQGIDRRSLPYHHWMQPYAAWYSTILCFIVCLVSDCLSPHATCRVE